MTEPFRLIAQKALTEHLETISVAIPSYMAGAPQSLTGKVFRGRSAFGSGDPELMLSILEDPRAQDRRESNPNANASKVPWWMILQGWVPDDAENPTDPAHYLAAAVIEKLAELKPQRAAQGDGILGIGRTKPCVDSISIGSPVVRPPDDISSKAYFWLDVTLTLVEDHEKQFT